MSASAAFPRAVFQAPDRGPAWAPAVTIARHPAGGWTHAIRANTGTARIYRGNFSSARAANRALRSS